MSSNLERELIRAFLAGFRRRAHVAIVSGISFAGFAFGVFALILVMSMLEGFQTVIRADLIAGGAHALVVPSDGRLIEDAAQVGAVLAELDGAEVESVVAGTALAGRRGQVVGRLAAVEIIGRSGVEAVRADPSLAQRLGVGVGDELVVVSPRTRLTPLGPVPVRSVVKLVEIRRPRQGQQNGQLVLPLDKAQRLLWGSPAIQRFELRSNDPWELADRVAALLESAGLSTVVEVQGFERINGGLLLALRLERAVIFLAVSLMLLVAGASLLCNVAMVVAEKKRAMAVLQALGLPARRCVGLIWRLGAIIGLAGTAVGSIAGIVGAFVLDRSELLALPAGLFAVDAVPFRLDPPLLALITLIAAVVAVLTSWLPARSLSTIDLQETLSRVA